MAGKDKLFGIDEFNDGSSVEQVQELEIPQGEPLGLHFQVGEDPNANGISELRFRLHLWDVADKDPMVVQLNGATLNDLEVGEEQQGTRSRWLECQLRPEQVNRGENKVELLLEHRDDTAQAPPVLDSVQLAIRY